MPLAQQRPLHAELMYPKAVVVQSLRDRPEKWRVPGSSPGVGKAWKVFSEKGEKSGHLQSTGEGPLSKVDPDFAYICSYNRLQQPERAKAVKKAKLLSKIFL